MTPLSAPAKRGRGTTPKGWWRGRRIQRDARVLVTSKHVRSLLPAKRIFRNDNEAPRPAPPPPRFARYASSSGPPPPLRGGGRCVPSRSRDASASELWQRTARSVRLQKIRGGRAPKGANLGPHHRMRRAPIAARSPFDALPRLWLRPCAEARSRPRFTRCSTQALGAASFLGLTSNDPQHVEDRRKATRTAIENAISWLKETKADTFRSGVSGGEEAISKSSLSKLMEFLEVIDQEDETIIALLEL